MDDQEIIPTTEQETDMSKDPGNFYVWLSTRIRSARHLSQLAKTQQYAKIKEFNMDVDCSGCPDRCCTAGLQIPLEKWEFRKFKHTIVDKKDRKSGIHVLQLQDNGHCYYYQDNACAVYNRRPAACRLFDCRIYGAGALVDPCMEAAADQWNWSRWANEGFWVLQRAVNLATQDILNHSPVDLPTALWGGIANFQEYLGMAYEMLEQEGQKRTEAKDNDPPSS